jgi:acetyltransferase-like isoleucine patch superfamily enzyme
MQKTDLPHASLENQPVGSATMTRDQLQDSLASAVRYPHNTVHKGKLILSPQVYETPGRETNLVISPFALLDCTGSIQIGPWCNIGPRTRIYTHDTIHMGKSPLLQLEEEFGVLWQDKRIGSDVWIHDGAIVLYQVTHIPDGVVVGAGSVLTKNPKPYEIWAGSPARKIGARKKTDTASIKKVVTQKVFLLNCDK